MVIKIAKRETRESFLRDVAKFRSMLKFSLFFYPKLERLADPIDALETVERQTLREMDFTAEIAGAQRLATLASEQSDALPHLRRLGFPDYFAGFSNERLLVSGFVEGKTLAEWLDSGGLPYEALLDLFRIHGYFLFVRGEFHGDLHPGNVIWHEGKFWFLDNANIETVPPQFGRGIFQMMVLLGQGDLPRAADQLAALSLKPLGASQLAGFRSRVQRALSGLRRQDRRRNQPDRPDDENRQNGGPQRRHLPARGVPADQEPDVSRRHGAARRTAGEAAQGRGALRG